MNDNVLTSYSFLAALSENETDIYKTVYLPSNPQLSSSASFLRLNVLSSLN